MDARPRPMTFAWSKCRWVCTMGVALALLAGCDKPKQSAAPPPTPAVGVRAVAMKGVNQTFEFVGRIKAVNKVEVRARVEGFLEQVLFREGQDVKTGDLLYQIEKVQFQALVDQRKAALDSDRAKVLQTRAVLTQAEVNLDYTDIRSPIDGRIGRTAYTVGNLVNPASGVLATIVSQDPIYVL